MCQFSENGPPKVIGANFQPSYLRAQEELGRKQGIYDYLHTQRSRVNQVLNYFVQLKKKIHVSKNIEFPENTGSNSLDGLLRSKIQAQLST